MRIGSKLCLMRRCAKSLEDVQRLIATTMGAQSYAAVRAAYSEHAISSVPPGRRTVAERQQHEIRQLADLVQARAVAVARAQCGRRHLCAVQELARVLERVHGGGYACEAAALGEIEALCAGLAAMERECTDLAAAAAAEAYGIATLARTGQTVLVACQLLRVRPNRAGRVDDEYVLERLPSTHKHLLHEVLVGALVMHAKRLATTDALLRAGSPRGGAAEFAAYAERARARVRAVFVLEARKEGAAERVSEVARAVESLRAEVEELQGLCSTGT